MDTSLAFSGVGVGSITLLPWVQALIQQGGWRSACWTMGTVLIAVLVPHNLYCISGPKILV
jgi:hypothetical protein